jgi:nucleoid-associated protein
MDIRNAVAHRLNKFRNARGATVAFSDTEIVKSPALTQLLKNILESYASRSSRHTGAFEADTERFPFAAQLRSLLNGDSEFLEFSRLAMGRLRDKISDVTFASGGYLLFVAYTQHDCEMLLVAKLSTEQGAIFSEDMHEVVASPYLNVERLQVAARIDLDAWRGGDERFLTFVMKQDQAHPSEYFREFVGCRIDQDSRVESKKLVRVVKDFANHLATEGFIPFDQVPDVQRRAFDFAEELRRSASPGGMAFDALANALWPDRPEVFLGFLNLHPEQPSAGFVPDATTFKKLSNINFKSRELSIKMTYDFKQQHVTTDGRRVVIENAPARLIQELTEGQ